MCQFSVGSRKYVMKLNYVYFVNTDHSLKHRPKHIFESIFEKMTAMLSEEITVDIAGDRGSVLAE